MMGDFFKKIIRIALYLIPIAYIFFYVISYAKDIKPEINKSIMINEVMADNISGLSDENGKRTDWIELYNNTDKIINLDGYSIGKKKNMNKAYKLPSIDLQPKTYLILYADGQDYCEEKYIHLNFELGKGGETLYLFSNLGDIVDSLEYSELNQNITFGRRRFNSNEIGEFAYATPGKDNPDIFIKAQNLIEDTKVIFSALGGNYSDEILLKLKTKEKNAVILYTLDGSEPLPDNALIYSEPIIISATDGVKNKYVTERCIPSTSANPKFSNYLYEYGTNNVYKGTVVRARIYADGMLSASIGTETYFIDSNYSLPIVSIVADPDELFGNDNGIYVCGSTYYSASKLNIEDGMLANYYIDKSVDGHIEIWDTNASKSVFKSDIKLKLGGAYSRIYNLEKAFNIDIKDKKIQFPVFAEEEEKLYSYNSFSLKSTGGGESIENSYQKHLLNTMLLPLNIGTKLEDYCILFLDGEYWGIYSLLEPKTEEYYIEHYGVADIEYFASGLKGSSNKFVEELNELVSDINTKDLTDDYQYKWIQRYVDIDNFTSFIASDIYIGNYDCVIDFDHNLMVWRSSKFNQLNPYEDKRLRWTPIDMDSTLFADGCSKTVLDTLVKNKPDKIKESRFTGILFKKLWERPDFRNKIAKEIYRLSDVIFSEELINSNFNLHYNTLNKEMEENLKRLELYPNKKIQSLMKFLGDDRETIHNMTLNEWKKNMALLHKRLQQQEDIIKPGLAEYTSLEVDEPLSIEIDNSYEYYALFSKGFSMPTIQNKNGFVWSVGTSSELDFIIDVDKFGTAEIIINIECATLKGAQKVDLFLNDEFLQQKTFINGVNSIYIPKSLLNSGFGNLRLEYIDVTSPAELGIGEDETNLAIRVSKISFESNDYYYTFNNSGEIDFKNTNHTKILVSGFAPPIINYDKSYAWTIGNESRIEFITQKQLKIIISAYSITEDQPVKIYINNDYIGDFDLLNNQMEIDIQQKYAKKGLIYIDMVFPNAISPKELGNGTDESLLAWRIYNISFHDM